ncbi:MAG: rhomboid family intrarane serine protease [Solirubrobacteraceae bacterium]|nr:rhomboid family intrarane serine protease [Solirubrobacteraceae bacterium]
MATGPDLFVVCKNCGAEVSPYITECPYCGTRLRKRAPKIERDGTISEPRPRRQKGSRPSRPRRERRMPGLSAPAYGTRPWATIVIVALSLGMWVALIWIADFRVIPVSLSISPERLLYGVFAYFNGWYQLAVLLAIGLYGWLLERRHGPLLVVALFVLGGIGGLAVAVSVDAPAVGANGAALALLCAWAMRDGLAARRNHDYEGDLIGTAVISAVVFLMPAAVVGASWIAGGVGVLVGAVAGALLARAPES